MTVTHRDRLTADGELNRVTEAATAVGLYVTGVIGGAMLVGDFHGDSFGLAGDATIDGVELSRLADTPRFLSETPWTSCQSF